MIDLLRMLQMLASFANAKSLLKARKELKNHIIYDSKEAVSLGFHYNKLASLTIVFHSASLRAV